MRCWRDRCARSMRRLAVAGVVLAPTLAGCAAQQTWIYRAESSLRGHPSVLKTVAVPPLVDERLNRNLYRVAFAFIPLFPYGWMTLDAPESRLQAGGFGFFSIITFKPTEDIAKALADELQNSGVFKEAFFTFRAAEADLTFEGRIKSLKYEGKLITYGLSSYGTLLWVLGFPATTFSNEMEVSFALRDNHTGGVLWTSRTYRRSVSGTSWVYSVKPDFLYADLLKQVVGEAMPELRQGIQALPAATFAEHR